MCFFNYEKLGQINNYKLKKKSKRFSYSKLKRKYRNIKKRSKK